MKNLNEHVSKMRKLINSRHGIIKPFLNEQEEEEKVNFEETNDLKEDCEELKETLQDLIDSLEKACASEDIVDTLKRDFTFSNGVESSIPMMNAILETINNPIGL
jgi:hypothetical protein